ncbi:MAG: GDP-mannose 4,6-dehydratase, partial [Alphaproteobacteria bacterium]|nr:GDP-mannose 4,6-dehydratase [Alphaproteobacteria bacterium]
MTKQKTAIIIGITGQDGAYLAQVLCAKNYRVIGVARRIASYELWRLQALGLADSDDITLGELDIMDFPATLRLLREHKPDEIYNLGGVSSVASSFAQPLVVSEMIGLGTLRLLEAILASGLRPCYYQASSSEMFGHNDTRPTLNVNGQTVNEQSDFAPVSPYGTAKLYAHWLITNYREAHNLHASSAILFNHESPLRDVNFVSRKIIHGLVALSSGSQEVLTLGNIDNVRDWGFAGDYMQAAWAMLQAETADDYIIATGKPHSVRSIVEHAAAALDFDLAWEGEGANTTGIDKKSGRLLVAIDTRFYRPTEPDPLIG